MSARGGNPQRRTFVVGVGVTKFEKPLSKNWDYPDMGREAGRGAAVILLLQCYR
jgi:hypothetical protein